MRDSTVITHADVYIEEIPTITTDSSSGIMFSMSRSHHGRNHFGRPKEDRGGKKRSIRIWLSKKKHKHHDHGVMTSSESVPTLHASLAPVGFDVPDEASRAGNVSPATTLSMKPLKVDKDTTEAIEEEVTIGKTTLPTPEPRPKIEKNGYDVDTDAANSLDPERKKPRKKNDKDDDCLVGCIYVAQQCCECTIS